MTWRAAVIFSVLIAHPAGARGQTADSNSGATERRARNRPILRIQSEFPTAPTVALEFAADGNAGMCLYSGGLDKLVRRWRLVGNADSSMRLQFETSLKWPIYRGLRGRINALDVIAQPGGHRLAIGGFGAKSSQVNLLEVNEPTFASTLFDFATAGRQVVWALAFHPDDKYLIVGEGQSSQSDAANIAVWNVGGDRLQVSSNATPLREVVLIAVSPDGRSVAAAGPAADGNGNLVVVWDISRLASGFRDPGPGQRIVQKSEPLQSVRVPANWPRTIRGLAWWDNDTWVAGTVLGVVSGTVRGDTNRAGFANFQSNMSRAGLRYVESAAGVPEIKNFSDQPLKFSFAATDLQGNVTGQWQRNQTLAPGAARSFRGNDGIALSLTENGAEPLKFYKQHCLECWPYVTALAASPNRRLALGVWHEESGHIVLRKALDTFGTTLPDSTFREVHSVTLSPDARFVAAAGVADVFHGTGSDRSRHTVYQIRVWSAESGRLLAKVPDDTSTGSGPRVGGPIAGVGIAADDAGNPAVRFTVSHVTDRSPPDYQQFLPTFPSFGIQPAAPLSEQQSEKPMAVVTTGRAQAAAQDLSPIDVAQGRLFRVLEQRSGWINVELLDSDGKLQNRWIKQDDVNLVDRWPWPQLTRLTQVDLTAESPRLGGQVQLTVSRWKLNSGEQELGLFPCQPGNEPTCGVQFQKDGRQLVALGLPDGIQIWDVERVARDGRGAILRSFYGHDSQITCLDVSPDARWLASGSADGTICGWSLDGLGRGNELGLSIDGGLRITSVVRNSPAWEAGFEEGQVVQDLFVAGRPITDRRWIRQALLQPVPGEELLANVRKDGSTRPVQLMTPVSWDPLWTYYPFHDGYWVMWTPAGYFTSAGGSGFGDKQSRVEWHVNPGDVEQKHGRQQSVFTMRAIDFEQEFKNEETVTRVAKSLQPAEVDLPLVPKIRLEQLGGTVRLVTELTGESQQVVERSLWLNGRRVTHQNPVTNGNRPLDATLSVRDYRSGRNKLTAIVTVSRRTAGGVQRTSFVRTETFEHASANSARPRLHYVGVGVTRLDESLANSKLRLIPLDSPDNDVIEVGQALRQAASGLAKQGGAAGWDVGSFDRGTFRVLAEGADKPPTKPNILDALAAAARDVHPDDFAVIMLAGHGVLQNLDGQPDDFHFVAEDQLVSRTDLADGLAALPCRSLLVLDTCHSGASKAANIEGQVEGLIKVLVGPQILTSCGRDQESEVAAGYDHGLFTLALLEAIDGRSRVKGELSQPRDRNGDGIVSVEEICTFVQDRTPDLIRILRMDRIRQDPQVLRSTSFEEIGRFPASLR